MGRLRAAVAASALLVALVPVVVAGPAAALDEPIDLRAEHDAPQSNGPLVLEDLGEVAGPQVELTFDDDVQDNPSEFSGNVTVDVDPDAQTITVTADGEDCFETVLVEITTDEIASITNLSDTLFNGPATRTESVSGGVVSILWNTDAPCEGLVGQAVFEWTTPVGPQIGTATLDPDTVTVGDPVTVSGTLCFDGVVLFDVVPEGGTVQDAVYSAEVETNADGTWEHVIDTTGWTPGDYVVEPIECIEPEDDPNRDVYNYDPLPFTVLAAQGPTTTTTTEVEETTTTTEVVEGETTTTTTETPVPPTEVPPTPPGQTPAAQPVTATPTFTG